MSARYRHATEVLWRRTSDRVLVLPLEGELVSLTGTGVALWELLAAPVTADELVGTLADAYGAEPSVVSRDVLGALDDLRGRGLVTEEQSADR